jgi:D-glycero-alpha-D-manno-heptose 1-phosphate guanylyltransferase
MKMFVLAGGFGTRLESVLAGLPKPLAPIKGIPFLRLQLDNWRRQGVRSFTFLLHYKADLIIEFLEDYAPSYADCKIDYLVEPHPYGTGGSLSFAMNKLNYEDSFLVANADTWLGFGIEELIHSGSPTIAVVRMENTGRYGGVLLKNEHQVISFSEKNKNFGPGLVNAGVYKLSSDLFKHWDGMPFSLEQKIFPELVLMGRLNALVLKSDFIDIGIPEDYEKFCNTFNNVDGVLKWS